MILANWSSGAYIVATIFAIIIISVLCVLLILRIVHERRNFKEELASFIEGVLTKQEMTSMINSFISKSIKDTPFSLIYLELDEFKNIKNAFGPEEAKKVIETMINKVESILPHRVKIGRFGPEEFLIFVREDIDRSECVNLAERIRSKIKEPIKIYADTFVDVTASMGIAFFPNHGSNLKELLKSLMLATYIAKKEGGNKVVIYSSEIGDNEEENLEYYTQVKRAIENKEFQLYYQPIIDLHDEKVIGAEALLRWNHPEYGLLSPFKFINILEQSGDINWIGLWGLESLIIEYLDLKNEFAFSDYMLTINLSPKQLAKEGLVTDFLKIIKKYKMDPRQICVEIEEFIIFEQHRIIRENVIKLKEIGFKIAVDGFALDHGTLEKLNVMPIDIIKLDKSFLNDESRTYILEKFTDLLIDFAKENNILIISEGVETYNNLTFIKSRNLVVAQGYYFSEPITGNELKSFIKNEQGLKDKFIEPNSTYITASPDDDLVLNSNLSDVQTEELDTSDPLSDKPIENNWKK